MPCVHRFFRAQENYASHPYLEQIQCKVQRLKPSILPCRGVMSAAPAQPQARPSRAPGRPAACARSASRGASATHGMLMKLTSLLPGQSLSLLPLVSQRSALDCPAYILGPCPTIFHYYSKGLAALQAAARSVEVAGDLSSASVKLGHLGSCEQPISAAVEPWWQRLAHCCPCSHQCTGLASAEQASWRCRRSAPGKLALQHQPGPFERI